MIEVNHFLPFATASYFVIRSAMSSATQDASSSSNNHNYSHRRTVVVGVIVLPLFGIGFVTAIQNILVGLIYCVNGRIVSRHAKKIYKNIL